MGCCQSAAATSAYPGNRRPVKPTYQPNDNEYKSVDKNTKVCTAHFVTCPGGNALRLVDKPNRAAVGEEVNSGGLARYISGEFNSIILCCLFVGRLNYYENCTVLLGCLLYFTYVLLLIIIL